MTQVVVTQLIVDASGAKTGVDDYVASMAKAKQAAVDASTTTGTAFDRAQKQWQASLAATSPQIKASIQMAQALARQQAINTQAVQLGIATQDAAAAQLDKVRAKYQAYVDQAGQAGSATGKLNAFVTGLAGGFSQLFTIAAGFGLAFSAAAIIQYGKQIFDTTATLQDQADQILGAGGNVEALQAYRSIFLTSGIALDAGDKILQHLTKSLGDAAEGSKQAQDGFTKIYGTARQASNALAGLTADQALPLIAKQLLAVTDPTVRASAEMQIFGRTGQQLESALQTLASGSVNDLIARAKELGVVIDADMIQKAQDAKDEMSLEWMKLSVALAPLVTQWVDDFTKITSSIDGSTSSINGLIDKVETLGAVYAGARIGALFGGAPGAIIGGVAGFIGEDLLTRGGNNATPNAYGQTTDAFGNASIGNAANDNTFGIVPNTLSDFTDAVTAPAAQNPPAWKPTQADIDAYNKIKETFDGYLKQLQQAAAVDTLSASQKQIEDNTIKAAVIDQKAHGVAARDTAKTYKEAVGWLGQQNADLVSSATVQSQINALNEQQNEQIDVAYAGLSATTDTRDLIIKDLQDEVKAGIAIGDQYAADRKTLEAKNAIIQQITDETKFGDYIANLKEENSLAGMTADEREREEAVLQQMHAMHGQLSDDQANEVHNLIAQRQELQQVGQALDSVVQANQSLAEGILDGNKNALQQWFDAVKEAYVKLLAWMAAQAIINPIVVPVFQGLVGSTLGLVSGGAAGANPLAALGALGNLSSTGSVTGSSGFLGGISTQISNASNWLTGSINNLGASLGFSAGTSVDGISTIGVTASKLGTGGFAAPNIPGSSSAFGSSTLMGTLDQAAAGLALAQLATSVTGGNSGNSAIGSVVGGIAGSLIPGVGTLIGTLAGGVIGGLFGPTQHPTSTATFDANGVVTGYGGKNATTATNQDIQTASGAVSQTISALNAAGVTLSDTIDKLTISSNKASTLFTGNGSKINVGKDGDVDAAISGTLNYLLKGASSSNADVSEVLGHYNATGGVTADNATQFASDIAFAQGLATTTHQTTVQLGDAADALKTVQSAYDADIQRAQSLGLSTSELLANEQKDIQAMAKATSDAYVAQFQSITAGIEPQLDDYQSAAKNISDTLAQATTDMTALSGSMDDVQNAANAARAALASAFNTDIASQLEGLVNAVRSGYDQLQATEAQRVADAQTVGGDLAQVNALNSAEMQKYIAGLSDADRATLVSEGILTAAETSFAQSMTSVSDGLDALIDTVTDTGQAATQAAQDWTSAQTSLTSASQALLVSGPGVSPQNAYLAAQQQYESLFQSAQTDPQAASSFASFANTFLQASETYNATGGQFSADQAMVQSDLASLSTLAGNQASAATDLATQAAAQLDTLNAMKDQLASGAPNLTVLQQQLQVQQDLSDTMEAVLEQLGGHRAAGGPVMAGKSYLVGEYRAEMFTPSASGYIAPQASAAHAFVANDNSALVAQLQALRTELKSALGSAGGDSVLSALKRVEAVVSKSGGDQTTALKAVRLEMRHATNTQGINRKRRKQA